MIHSKNIKNSLHAILKNLQVFIVFALFSLVFLTPPIFAQNSDALWLRPVNDEYIPEENAQGEFVIDNTQLQNLFDNHNLTDFSLAFPSILNTPEKYRYGLDSVYEVTCNGDLTSLYDSINENFSDYYRKVEIIPHIKPLYTPNDYHNLDQNYGSNWQLDMINAEGAWDITKGSSTIPIAILETEYLTPLANKVNNFDSDHEDLANNVIFHNDNVSTDIPHATFVAGCASAVTDNNKGLSSIGFNSGLMLYRGTHPDNMNKAVNKGARVISCSFVFCDPTPSNSKYENYKDVINSVTSRGAIVVAGAGNGVDANGNPRASCPPNGNGYGTGNGYAYPASYDNVLSITSVGDDNKHWDYKDNSVHTHNDKVDLCAPGYDVLSTLPDDNYGRSSGTSFSAPITSGLVALILSVNPCLGFDEVKDILYKTAVPVDDEANYPGMLGAGRIDAYQAVQEAQTYGIQDDITNNTVWNEKKYVRGVGLTIKPGATLTITDKVKFDQLAKIVVKPGAELVIDGGHLTSNDPNCGNLFWLGVEVQGKPSKSQRPKTANGYSKFQGKVVIKNGGTIENAVRGVSFRTESYDKKGGGFLIANNANFINNIVSIEMNPYTDVYEFPNGSKIDLGDKTRIENSTFKTTDDLLENTVDVRHVRLNGVNAIKMRGNTFVNKNSSLGTPGNGDKGIAIEASNSSFSLVDKYHPGLPGSKAKNTFKNLLYGVKADGFSNTSNIVIRGNEFTDVYRSIYLRNTKSATVMHNTMVIPEYDQNMFPLINWPNDASYGTYIDGGEGFKVEENYLKEIYPYSQTYGIIVNNTGAYNNEIYKNDFKWLYVAMQAQYINRGTASSPTSSPDVGLKFICNDASLNRYWDFKVVGQSDNPNTQGIGIASKQAVSVFENGQVNDYPVGNIFSTGVSTNYFFDYHNDDAEKLYYRYHKHATEKEEPLDYINITTIGDEDEHTCPSKDYVLQEITIDDLYPQLGAAQVALNSSRLILDIWEDGGDADLDEEVETTAPWEVYEEFNDLMAESPYLSEDVIIAVIENPSFTDLMVKLLMIANPHVIESDEVMDALYNREPPMPESYIDQILAEEGTISQLTLLRADVAADYHLVRNIGQHIKRNYRRDTVNDYALDSLINFVSRQEELTDRYELAGIYLRNEMFDDMQNCLDNIPNQFELSDQEYDDHQNYLDLYAIAEDLVAGGSSIDQLDSNEVSLLNTIAGLNRPGISQMAVAMLKANDPDEFFRYEVILDPDPEGEKSGEGSKPDKEKHGKISGKELTIYPNPAFSFVTVAYAVEESLYKQLSVVVHGSDGNKVIDQNLPGYTNEVIVDLKKLSSGIYTVSLMGDGQRIATKKLNLMD